MTVSQLIDWLKTQDQEATVEVVHHKSDAGHGSYYMQGGCATTVDFEPKYSDYTNIQGNQYYPSTRTLLLGLYND